MKVSFLQPRGTFSHEFAVLEFGEEIDCIPKPDFAKVVEAVAKGEAEAGVIPFLNSSGVTVEQAHTALHHHLSVVTVSKCAPLHVKHHVAVADGFKNLKKLISKKEVFPQITTWLTQWAEKPEEIPAASTATALQDLVKSSKEEKEVTGVVCNELAVNLYGGNIVHKNVQNSGNTTLFLIIERRHELTQAERVLIALQPNHEPDHREVIREFAQAGFPLMFSSIWGDKASDRPLFFEFKGPISSAILSELTCKTKAQVVGQYKEAESLASCVSQYFE